MPRSRGDVLPDSTRAAMTHAAVGIAKVVYIALHPGTEPGPVIGVYLASASLLDAETAARDIWQAARDSHSWLREWVLVRAEVPIMPGYDW
ncbi:hypothetical protein ACFZAT_10460 [Streptomyces sp. NPDC008163]|uniref:hypothetical protein n=1 Tax=Streptomyces sp. NPDC008163 TaxID=3364818 RepID=UPI0036E32A2A